MVTEQYGCLDKTQVPFNFYMLLTAQPSFQSHYFFYFQVSYFIILSHASVTYIDPNVGFITEN